MDDPIEAGEAALKRWEETRSSVMQAAGMVSAQAACTPDEAMALLRDRSDVRHESILVVAQAVLDREIRFG